MTSARFFAAAALLIICDPALALSPQEINAATFDPARVVALNAVDPFIVKAQILLGRQGISPGVVDGIDGQNFHKAIAQFKRQQNTAQAGALVAGLQSSGGQNLAAQNLGDSDQIDPAAWTALGGDTATDIIVDYTITEEDAKYDYADEIPHDYAKQAKMKRLSYTSPEERLGERFHMSEGLLKQLNPGKDLAQQGVMLSVAALPHLLDRGTALHVDAVKSTGMVVAYGPYERILASYPATIGSEATPSPSGEYTVVKAVRNPNYTYDPDKNFKQGKNDEVLTLPPGPNNPVGTVWIALSKPTFGIHGAPEPAKVSKTSSHGCVRLTNWDAEDLAGLVKPGVVVRFVE